MSVSIINIYRWSCRNLSFSLTLNSLSHPHGMEHTQIGPSIFNTSLCSAFIIEYRGSIQLCLEKSRDTKLELCWGLNNMPLHFLKFSVSNVKCPNKYEPQHDKTKWYVSPAKTQISLGICPVWSESLLCVQLVAKAPNFLHADS